MQPYTPVHRRNGQNTAYTASTPHTLIDDAITVKVSRTIHSLMMNEFEFHGFKTLRQYTEHILQNRHKTMLSEPQTPLQNPSPPTTYAAPSPVQPQVNPIEWQRKAFLQIIDELCQEAERANSFFRPISAEYLEEFALQ
ncbi:MAG: hypothetical protein ACK4GN_13175, partial [Runella sp.]